MSLAKLIEYAYPTSTHATKAGYGKTGCWFIRIYKSVNSWETVKDLKVYFTDKGAAKLHADTLPEPYHVGMKYF